MRNKIEQQLKCCLALWRAPKVGPATFAKLTAQRDSESVLQQSTGFYQQFGLAAETIAYLQKPDWRIVDADIQWLQAADNHYIITQQDKRYPELLAAIDSAPPLLFVRGQVDCLRLPQIAMVGSRNPTAQGKENAYAFAYSLVEAGAVVTSGLALGIDGVSHTGALAAKGQTIAVLGTGIERIYPSRHQALAEQIMASGALVSEFPPGVPTTSANFPRRNRIISGLSLGVLVVEAAKRSGSLITARYATEQGREVFAIPGSIHNSVAKGCHCLIQQGAKLVQNMDDMISELPQFDTVTTVIKDTATIKNKPMVNKDYQRVLASFDDMPTPLDILVARTGLPITEISSILLRLEMDGYVTSSSTGYNLIKI